mgnify:CR=1 FL=1
MIRLRSRKGVSGAISAMFIIAIFFICLVSMFVIQGLTNSYNQTVLDRNRMDWERNSEHITFIRAAVANNVLNATFSNDGRVTLHIVQVWLSEFSDNNYSSANWQKQFWTSRYISSGETVNGFGSSPNFRRVNVGSIGDPVSLSGLTSEYYKIKLVTERGNTFECQVPYPPSEGGTWEGNTYAIIVTDYSTNFQFRDNKWSPGGWTTAWIKKLSGKNDHVLYRIKLRNTTPLNIVIDGGSFMIQFLGAQVPSARQIVQEDESGSMIPNNTPAPYSNKITIPAKQDRYVYFAAGPDAEHGGGQQVGEWIADPAQGWVLVAFLVSFHFENEPNVPRILTLPGQSQLLKPTGQ